MADSGVGKKRHLSSTGKETSEEKRLNLNESKNSTSEEGEDVIEEPEDIEPEHRLCLRFS